MRTYPYTGYYCVEITVNDTANIVWLRHFSPHVFQQIGLEQLIANQYTMHASQLSLSKLPEPLNVLNPYSLFAVPYFNKAKKQFAKTFLFVHLNSRSELLQSCRGHLHINCFAYGNLQSAGQRIRNGNRKEVTGKWFIRLPSEKINVRFELGVQRNPLGIVFVVLRSLLNLGGYSSGLPAGPYWCVRTKLLRIRCMQIRFDQQKVVGKIFGVDVEIERTHAMHLLFIMNCFQRIKRNGDGSRSKRYSSRFWRNLQYLHKFPPIAKASQLWT